MCARLREASAPMVGGGGLSAVRLEGQAIAPTTMNEEHNIEIQAAYFRALRRRTAGSPGQDAACAL